MAGIGKYKKGVAFKLKSGNNPSFEQMGSSPANLNNFGIGPGSSPYRQEDEDEEEKDDSKKSETTKNITKEQGGDAKKSDKGWVKALKIGTTLLSGGIQGVYGGEREYPKINYGKKTKEVTETPGQKVLNQLDTSKMSLLEYDDKGNQIYPDDPKHSQYEEQKNNPTI